MDFIQPAGPVVGPFPLHAAVAMICGLHLFINMVVLGSVSSEKSVKVAQVEISPQLQCVVGAFALIGIPVIIHGGMGAIYRAPGHLSAYNYYLVGCMAFAALWFGIFVKFQNPCVTVNRPGRLATMTCNHEDESIFILLIVVMMLTSAAIYLVWSMQENIKERLETDLFRYKEPYALYEQMADDAAAQMAYDAAKMAEAEVQWKVSTKRAPPQAPVVYHAPQVIRHAPVITTQAAPVMVQAAAPPPASVITTQAAPVIIQSAAPPPVSVASATLPVVMTPSSQVIHSAPAVAVAQSVPVVAGSPVAQSLPVVRQSSPSVVLS
eukprot:TRINITY_DN355_c0_g1_i1.p1 TRINITY_DN355_c0_g1~~TRINITY_DN355_c0_g1_i1.p1  ORF type:complete len:347 (-),score=61.02 TRINITY_DN355_c0_g1_i1:50-1015(-)